MIEIFFKDFFNVRAYFSMKLNVWTKKNTNPSENMIIQIENFFIKNTEI